MVALRRPRAYHRGARPHDGGTAMIAPASNLVTLLQAVDRLPLPDPAPQGRGHPQVYSDRLMLKAVVVMIVRRLPTPHLLMAVLTQPTAEMAELRTLLSEHGRFPCRRTW